MSRIVEKIERMDFVDYLKSAVLYFLRLFTAQSEF